MARLKTTLLLGLLTGIVLAAGYAIGGQQGLLVALVLSAVMNLGSYWFSDKMVLSMYRAKPLTEAEAPEAHRILRTLAQRAGIPMPPLYVIGMDQPNAFATGRNERHAAVAVTRGLLKLLSPEELKGVLAHELSHVTNRDVLISTIAATLSGALSTVAQMAYFGGMGSRRSDASGNPFASMLFLLLSPIMATLIHLAVSRSREFLADEHGAKFAGSPLGLADALVKLEGFAKHMPLRAEPKYEATAHLFIVNPFRGPRILQLFSTHPPVEERVRRLKAMRG